MSSPAEIVAQALVDQGVVIQPGGPDQDLIPPQQTPGDGTTICYVTSKPDDVDQGVFLYDEAGLWFGRDMRQGRTQIHPGIKIIVRALDATGYGVANAVAVAIDGIPSRTTITTSDGVGHKVQSVYRTSAVVALGEERNKRRMLWSLHARIAFQDAEPQLG